MATGTPRSMSLIVQGDRWIVNDSWGRALVFRARVVATDPVMQFRVWGDRAETRKGGPCRSIYRLKGDELTLCTRMDDRPLTTITAARGTGQSVLILKRSKLP
jgi:uncharacterized protein (TIGR03067 family)